MRAEVVRKAREIESVLQAALPQEGNEQGIVFPEERVAVEFAIFIGILLGVWNGRLAERKTEANAAQKVRG